MTRRWQQIEVTASPIIEAVLVEAGVSGWEDAETVLRFYLSPEDFASGKGAQLRSLMPEGTSWSESWTDEEDWAEGWKQYFKPTQLTGKLAVCPTWEDWKAPTGVRTIVMDPGMAFGTGAHATTRMCLQLLEQHVAPGAVVLDIGTGSGILAIGALHLGARHATCTDADPLCIPICRENLGRNGFGENVSTVLLGEGFAPAGHQRFPVILANLVTVALLSLAPEIAAHLSPDGIFIGSGTIVERLPEVLGAMQGAGLSLLEARTEGEWAAVAFPKPPA